MTDDRDPTDDRAPDEAATPSSDVDGTEQDAVEQESPAADAVEPEPSEDEQVQPASDDAAPPADLATDVTATDREAAANEAAERVRALQPRSVGLWGMRIAAGAATLALGAVAVVAGPSLPSVDASPRTESIVPAAPSDVRVCAGPLLALGDVTGNAGAIGVLADASLVADAAEQQGVPFADVDAEATVLRGGDDAPVAGAQIVQVDADAASGVATSECSAPSTSQWLVGGATTTGRSSVLTIANPGSTATSVDVRVLGTDGEVESVGSTGIAIAAGDVAIVDLAALAPGVAAPVVHVTASGGPVSARMQHSVVRTLTPGGVDVVDPTQASTSLAIPGVVVGEPTGIQTQEGFADAVPALRILAGESTQATITTIADGQEPIASTLDLVGGQVQEVDLSGLAAGTYAFAIEADEPIVAGVRQTRVDGDDIDLDWVSAAATPIDGETTVAIADGQSPRIHVLNLGDETTTATIGDEQVELAPHELRTVGGAAGITTIEGSGIVAAVTYSGSDGIAGHALTPRAAARDGIDVVQ